MLPIGRVYLSSQNPHACVVQDASRNVADLLPYLSHYSLRSHMGFGDRLVCCILKCTSFYIKLIARSDPAYWQLCQPHPPLHWTDHCRDQWRDVAYRWKYPKFSTAMHSKRFMDAAGALSTWSPCLSLWPVSHSPPAYGIMNWSFINKKRTPGEQSWSALLWWTPAKRLHVLLYLL